jgi:hypothetical protein
MWSTYAAWKTALAWLIAVIALGQPA